MNEEKKNEGKFEYSYSAPTESERREIESIRKQYLTIGQEDKVERLRRLNRRVVFPPKIIGFIIGILGTLVLGTGMAMVLEWEITAWGVVVGVLGAAIAAAAYPLYIAVLKRNKRKYGQQIIALSNEILHEE